MPTSADQTAKAKRKKSRYDAVALPHLRLEEGDFVEFVESDSSVRKIGWTTKKASTKYGAAGKVAVENRKLAQAKFARAVAETKAARARPVSRPESEAQSLMGSLAETMKNLTKAQKQFRADLEAAYEEGEALFKRAAG